MRQSRQFFDIGLAALLFAALNLPAASLDIVR
jgi:hypothetical protein